MNYRDKCYLSVTQQLRSFLYYQFIAIILIHYYNLRAVSVRKFVVADGTANF